MTLLIAVFAAVITTIIWYTNDRRSQLKLGTLALMYWGASLMWMVDAVVEYIELGQSILLRHHQICLMTHFWVYQW